MKTSVSILAVLGTAAVTMADPGYPSGIADCASWCGNSMISQAATYSPACGSDDFACMCKDSVWGYGIHDCAVEFCQDTSKAQVLIDWAVSKCQSVGVPISIAPATASITATGGATGTGASGGAGSGASSTAITTSAFTTVITSGGSTITSTGSTTIFTTGAGASGSASLTTFTSVFTSGGSTFTSTGTSTITGTGGSTATSSTPTTITTNGSTLTTSVAVTSTSHSSSTSSGPAAQKTAAPVAGLLAAAGLAVALL